MGEESTEREYGWHPDFGNIDFCVDIRPGETLEDLVEHRNDQLFHAGECSTPTKTLYCKECGGKDFNVGSGSYWTGVKCVKCKFELCIHDG